MEMGYRDHIVAKLSALAVAGGTTAMLFAASPVHTQFSATTNGSLSASGAKVALTITNGNLVATNLLPAVTTVSGTGPTATKTTTYYPTNSQTVTLKNSGSVPEDFSLNISQYNCGSLAGLPTTGSGATLAGALDQLKIVYTLGSGLQKTVTPFNHFGTLSCSSAGNTGNTQLTTPVMVPLGASILPGDTETATIQVELGAESQTSPNANDWNGATNVKIPYVITAEPADSGTPGPTLSSSSTTPPPAPNLSASSN